MPTVSLTPQQQSQIDAANAKVAAAKSVLDAASNRAHDFLDALNRCYCGHGKHAGTCTPLKSQVSFPSLADPKQCTNVDIVLTKCKTDCCSLTTCVDKVTQYNSAISDYNAANTNYKTAKDNLQAVLDAIAKDPTVSANTSIINTEINAQKSKDVVKWLFFGLAAVIIVGGAIFIGIKVLGGKSAS